MSENWQAHPQPEPESGTAAGPRIFTPGGPGAQSEPPAWQSPPTPAASNGPGAPANASAGGWQAAAPAQPGSWPAPPTATTGGIPAPPAPAGSGAPVWQQPPAAPYPSAELPPSLPAAPPQPGYPSAAYQPGGYQPLGAPEAYQAASARETESKAIVGLIMAIGSFVLCPVVLAIVALVMASQSSQAIAASGGRFGGSGMNTATRWIAGANILLSVLLLGGTIIAILVFASSGSNVIEHLPSPGVTNF
ncbi:MAG: hypothetical protein ACOYEV_04745 [Candidatus Nanopelagicales bacterium]